MTTDANPALTLTNFVDLLTRVLDGHLPAEALVTRPLELKHALTRVARLRDIVALGNKQPEVAFGLHMTWVDGDSWSHLMFLSLHGTKEQALAAAQARAKKAELKGICLVGDRKSFSDEALDGCDYLIEPITIEGAAQPEWLDPGFGVDPGDSAALLALRVAIDTHLGWNTPKSEMTADYAARVAEVAEELAAAQQKIWRQRLELRRLNRDKRAAADERLAHTATTSYADPQARMGRVRALVKWLHADERHLLWQLLRESKEP